MELSEDELLNMPSKQMYEHMMSNINPFHKKILEQAYEILKDAPLEYALLAVFMRGHNCGHEEGFRMGKLIKNDINN